MKTFAKLFAVAAAFGMLPVAAFAQAPAPSATATAPTPVDSISARSQAAPARPGQVSPPAPANDSVAAAAPLANRAIPNPGIGQPDGRAALPDQVTPIGREGLWFHNRILLPLVIAISAFVLILLLFVIFRFRRAAHPVPSRTTHNSLLEIAWTLIPVLILVAIALPSIRLLAHQYSPPRADLTIKVTGNQWYWTYSYPDNGGFEIVSNMLSEADDRKRGEPRLLGVDERMVVPAGATVKVIVTASDVIHSWGVPAFWVKMDAVPGRLNETWFKVDRPGLYYGQCYELCGARHGFMPIAVEVVTPAQFAAWIASKGGSISGQSAAAGGGAGAGQSTGAGGGAGAGQQRPASPDATANSPGPNPSGPAGGGTSATPSPTNVSAGTARPAATSQSQATSSRGI